MNTKYTQKEGDKSYVKLKNKINELPTEKVAEKLGLELTKNGNSYQGECPTGHPSEGGKCFSIKSDEKYWKCFHCEKGGDNIELIRVAKKIDFFESIKWAAREFNISHNVDFNNPFGKELSDEEKEKIRVFNSRAELFEIAFEWMHELLFMEDGENVLDYLVGVRGYDQEVLKDSEFCYFPPASEIKKYLLEKHPDMKDDIDKLPLFGSTGDSYRLALPYRNAYGKITGFIKRATPGAVKYKADKDGNPMEERYDSTAGLKKDDIFNLHKCRNLGTIILFEGYPDATYFYAAGMKNATAVGQGRLSKNHLESLRTTKVEKVILSFDNDKLKSGDELDKPLFDEEEKLPAGLENTISAVKLILNESDITPFVLDPKLLDPHKDPDEYFRANGFKATQDLYKKVKKGIIWIAERILDGLDKDDILSRQNARDELLYLTTLTPDAQDIAELKKMILDKLGLEKSLVNELIKESKKKAKIEKYKKIKNEKLNGRKRYFPFIERSTSSYSYLDTKKDDIYMGVPKDILENILISGGEPMPDVFPVLEADFDVKINDRIDYDNEKINLFVPTSYMLLNKTAETFQLRVDFPNIYKLLMNLIPNYRERKRFLNWLAGILQTREKQLTAWVLKGEQGAGKGIFLDKVLKEIFGRRQSVKVEDSDLQSDFNPWLKNTIIVAFNEVAHDNNTRNNIKSRIKAIITDPDVMINEKNIRNYFITNYVNCLFFSNEKVPLFIEDKDRRLNVVTTGPNLISFPWFKKDPDKFINSLKPEVPKFAQFLMNWKYDPVAAKTCIENEEKRAMVSVALNKFEEFANRLKNKDVDWFEENIIHSTFEQNQIFLGNMDKIIVTASDLEGRISKDLALQAFNHIYTNQQVNNMQLGRSLKLYGIRSERSRKVGDDNWYYAWD